MTRSLALCLLMAVVGCKCPTCSKCLPSPQHKDEARAGYPQDQSCLAKPSDDGGYVGYQVGGGATPCCRAHGDGPACDDGTWGWDYAGLCVPSKVVLDWWHGRKYQGGSGAYRIDGPRPLKRLEQKKEKECCEGTE